MPTTHETPRDLRKKLARVSDSNQSIKNKYREKQYELKKLNNCLSAMERSRDKWRLHCNEKKALVKNLEKKLCDITEKYDDLKAQITTIESLDKKKRSV